MLHFDPIQLVQNFPPEWAVFFLSMLPVTELRASIPIGIEFFNLPVWQTFIIAVIGNLIPTIIILSIIPHMHSWIIKQKFIGGVLKNKLEKTEKLFAGKHAKYGSVALILFVGIPLPLTGAWTGSLAAFIFNIHWKKSIPLITLGILMAATIVTIITLFAGGVFGR